MPISVLAGASFALVVPPTALTAMAWVGLAGFECALDAEVEPVASGARGGASRRWLDGAGRGIAFGFGANVVLLAFVPRVIARFTPLPFAAGIVALVLLALAQSVGWGVAGIVRQALTRGGTPRPIAFALAVYAATFVPSLFPWTPAGGLAPWPAMAQLAEHVGARGVSALIALSAGLLAAAIRAPRVQALAYVLGAAALPLAMALHGQARMRAIAELRARAPTAAIGLVDAGVPATTRWEASAAPAILANLLHLSADAEARGAELTIWPESAYPYVLPRGAAAGPAGNERLYANGVRGPLLVGAVTRDARGDRYNAVIAAHPDGTLTSEYDKMHLLWFGEAVPFAAEFPSLRRTFARGLGLLPGDHAVLAVAGRVRAGTLICFEDILPEAGREAAALSPNLLVNVTNDAWFSGSREPTMHLWLAAMRAIETRRDLVRAVNLGPTGLVDASGRIRDTNDLPIASALVVRAALLDGPPTLYARFGDGPWIVASLASASIILLQRRTHKRKRAPDP